VVIEDGQPVWDVWSAEELVLPPGKRFDVLVQAEKRGSYALRTLAYEQGARTYPEEVLAVARVGGDRVPSIPIPTIIAPRSEDLSGDPVSAERVFTLTEDQATDTFSINGHVFEHHHVFGEPTIYTVEQWKIRNATQEQHPFHLHTDYFQVISVNGVPYDAHGRQDTVIVPVGGEVVIRPAFYDFRGTVLFHCHILSHEDGGMMGQVTVG
jgi:FtsP/CotA-like multicopper oxidase with cupredoxin domain